MGQQSILQLLQRQCYSALTHSITLTIANLPPHSHLRTSFSRVTPIPYSSFTVTTHPSLTVSTHPSHSPSRTVTPHPSLSLHSLSLPLPHSHPSSLTVTPLPLPPLPHCYLSPLTVTPLPLPPPPTLSPLTTHPSLSLHSLSLPHLSANVRVYRVSFFVASYLWTRDSKA